MTSGALRRSAALIAALAWLDSAGGQSGSQSPPLVALSSNGVRAALEVVAPECERSTARKVAIGYDTSASIQRRIAGGEYVDVAFVTREVILELTPGHADPGSAVLLGRAGIGLGVRAGARRFDIGSASAIKQALLEAQSVAYALDGASRVHIERMFEQLGIAAEMRAKAVLEQGSARAAARVITGDAEILLTLVSEILPVDGMELLGPLPAEFQSYITFVGFASPRPRDPVAARNFLACLAAPGAAAAFAANGIDQTEIER